MTIDDGTIIRTVQLLDNRSRAFAWNIVVLSDGYRNQDLVTFANDVNAFITELNQTPPFNLLMPTINIWRVDVASTDSGADDPVACGGTGATARTYFDATLCSDGVAQRLIGVNGATAFDVARNAVPEFTTIIVIVNSTIYGGSGSNQLAVYSRAPGAVDIALHELGHSMFNLADEYEYYRGCTSGETDRNNHPGPDPNLVNVTVGTIDRTSLKWGRYVLSNTALPTTTNPNCAQCDSQLSPVANGIVGAFEGAHYYHCGAHRPEFNCKMRNLGQPFCRVCRNHIINQLTLRTGAWRLISLAWKGAGFDSSIYAGTGVDSAQSSVAGARSSAAPTIVNSNDRYMIWRGAGSDQSVYYSRWNALPGIWDPHRPVLGIGTSTGVAAAVFRGGIYLAWKGIAGDQRIWFAGFNPQGMNQQVVPNVGTSTRPALTTFRDRLYMAWKGLEGDQNIYFTSFNGNNWAAQASIPNVGTSTSPALAVLNDRLYMVWKGIAGDESMYYTTFNGSNWATQAPIPNMGTSASPSLVAFRNQIYMVWRGITGDQSIYITTFDGSRWAPQHNIFGIGSSDSPSIVVTGA